MGRAQCYLASRKQDQHFLTMKGKTVLITGANAGLGKATATALAAQGAHIIMLCRDQDKAEAARDDIIARSHATVDIVIADLGKLECVARSSSEIHKLAPRLDVLINNAGFMTSDYRVTADGFESTFAVNYLAHVLLTRLLIASLKAGSPSRIINITSSAHTRAKPDQLLAANRDCSGFTAYSNSKLANIFFTFSLARELQGTGITVNAVDPGFVDTAFGEKAGIPSFFRIIMPLITHWVKPPDEGASTAVKLASDATLSQMTGAYWKAGKLATPSKNARDVSLQAALEEKTHEWLKPWCLQQPSGL